MPAPRIARVFPVLLMALLGLSLLAAIQTTRAQPVLTGLAPVLQWAWVAAFGLAAGLSSFHRPQCSANQRGFWLGFNALMLLFLASSLHAAEPAQSAGSAALLALLLNTVFLCLLQAPDPGRLLRHCAYLFLGFTVLACLYVVVLMHFEQLPWVGEWPPKRIRIGDITLQKPLYGRRNSSYLGNPNLLGAFIALSLPVCYDWLVRARGVKSCLGALLSLLLLVYTLWHTASRASTLSALFGLAVFVLLWLEVRQHPIKRPVLLGLGGLLALLLGVFLYDKSILLNGLNDLLARKATLLSGREKAWRLLLQGIQSHPLWGVGFGMSQEQLLRAGGFTNPYGSHNIYLRIAAETGLPGLVGFVILMLWPLAKALQSIRAASARQPGLLILCMTTTCTFLFHAFFEDNMRVEAALFLYPMVGFLGVVAGNKELVRGQC